METAIIGVCIMIFVAMWTLIVYTTGYGDGFEDSNNDFFDGI